MKLTQQRLKELVYYDQKSGKFFALVKRADKCKIGDILGCPQKHGAHASHIYLRMWIEGQLYYAHRLAWLYVYGNWPKGQIDHINHNGCDNRIENLRNANHTQNRGNSRKYKNNKTGFKGVSLCKTTGKFRATIKHHQKQIWLGSFITAEEAHAAYVTMARKLFGDFAHAG